MDDIEYEYALSEKGLEMVEELMRKEDQEKGGVREGFVAYRKAAMEAKDEEIAAL